MADNKSAVAWVAVIGDAQASGDLAMAYDAVRGADGRVENLYLAMSQTPRAIIAADDHYRAVLHNPDNPLDDWLAEFAGTFVAILCGSDYAALNHGENFRLYLGEDASAAAWLAALRDGNWRDVLEGRALAVAEFTEKLSLRPAEMDEADIAALRVAGFDDKAISYLVQIVASFAYWARMINALGTRQEGPVGLSEDVIRARRGPC
ncbi:MAG: hypothetical protein WBB85_12385 [Albidovulum sp.]|uniref:hypothetical protein n=1 Tax=Albidovulum sp. TaxID=1872424 RepID=UPI003CC0A528